jgi:hypothetical protein
VTWLNTGIRGNRVADLEAGGRPMCSTPDRMWCLVNDGSRAGSQPMDGIGQSAAARLSSSDKPADRAVARALS